MPEGNKIKQGLYKETTNTSEAGMRILSKAYISSSSSAFDPSLYSLHLVNTIFEWLYAQHMHIAQISEVNSRPFMGSKGSKSHLLLKTGMAVSRKKFVAMEPGSNANSHVCESEAV